MPTVTNPPILDSTGQAIATALANVSIRPQIVDNCTTADSTKALSANQGKQLLDTINGATNYIARGNVSSGDLNNLTNCGTYNCDNCTNAPYTYIKLLVESDAAGSWIKQTATNILSPYQSCYRIKNVSEPWSDWKNNIMNVERVGITLESGLNPQYQGNNIMKLTFFNYQIIFVSLGFYSVSGASTSGIVGRFDGSIMSSQNLLLAGTRYSENNIWEDATYYITHEGTISILDGRQAKYGACGGIGII